MEQFNYTINSNNNQIFRKRHFNHLSMADRINIEKLLLLKNDKSYKGEKITIAYIAKIIGVNKSTISREIKRGTYKEFNQLNRTPISRYRASFGDGTYKKNQKRSHYKQKLKPNSNELIELTQLLNSGADPLTALCLYEKKHNKPFPLCEKSIYNYFNKNLIKLKRGTINPRKHKQKAMDTGKAI